ncbi:NYN domain-containing protein [Pacificispira sp.]|uniref:LabA-like NYN domain-containing protein n=1 Tax=Pacificispira sp. TaxID=2888761 RepID=UPI003B5192F0
MKLGIYREEKFAIFIDGANLYSAAKALGFDIDYKKLLTSFKSEGRLMRAFYYTALFEDQEYSPIRPLVDWLDYNGYTMVTKPAKSYTDSQGRQRIKGNMDMELAIDMLDMTQYLDHVVLFSGDGDFRSLVEAVQRRGVRVSVVSTIKSQPPMIADELRRQADNFIELSDLADSIARNFHDSQRPQAPAAQQRRSVRGPSADFEGDEEYEDDDEYEDEDDYAGVEAIVERTDRSGNR